MEHLQSLEHRQKVEKVTVNLRNSLTPSLPIILSFYLVVISSLKENEGCEASSKLPAMEADGLSLEEGEEGEESLGEGEQDCSVKQVILFYFHLKNTSGLCRCNSCLVVVVQDGWSSIKEVTLRDLTSDEQHDPDTVYGTSRLHRSFLRLSSSLV